MQFLPNWPRFLFPHSLFISLIYDLQLIEACGCWACIRRNTHHVCVYSCTYSLSLCKHIIYTSETGRQLSFHNCIPTCLQSPGVEFIMAELFSGVEIKHCVQDDNWGTDYLLYIHQIDILVQNYFQIVFSDISVFLSWQPSRLFSALFPINLLQWLWRYLVVCPWFFFSCKLIGCHLLLVCFHVTDQKPFITVFGLILFSLWRRCIAVFFDRTCLIRRWSSGSFIFTIWTLSNFELLFLAGADGLMGIYLFMIGAYDLKFRGEYNRHAQAWMDSSQCQVIGSLAMLSTEVSVLLLTYLTLEKYICVVYPFRYLTPGWRRTVSILLGIWVFGFIVAFLPLVCKGLFRNFYGTNGVCFPLHSEQPETLWAHVYSIVIFLGGNLFLQKSELFLCCFSSSTSSLKLF